MSSIVTDQGVVHYEVAGRGRPIILLHGWLGSWDHWADTMSRLGGGFRGYALDFWGFGDSGKHRNSFHISDFVALVDQFMDRLGIECAPIIGHSMGGTVALSLALTNPERVKLVVVVGSPIVGNSLAIWLQMAGEPWLAGLLWKFPFLLQAFLKLYSPLVTRQPKKWLKMIVRDISATTLESFFSSIRSLHHTDLTPRLGDISVPTLGIYGMSDVIVDPYQAKLLSQNVSKSHITLFPGSGHFPMIDQPDLFNQYLLNFLHENSE